MEDPREGMLEAFLVRLAHSRDADAFALRGGMLVRTWVPGRPIRDVDLICALPLEPDAIRRRLQALLATPADDDVVFDAEEFRVDRWDDCAGLTLYARGEVAGTPSEMVADLWFGLALQPRRGTVTTRYGAVPFQLCPHELVIASKLAVLAELGSRAWRPKDLVDVWYALQRFPPGHALGALLEQAEAWRSLLHASWWREPRAEMRWAREIMPAPLEVVVGEVRHALAPFGGAR